MGALPALIGPGALCEGQPLSCRVFGFVAATVARGFRARLSVGSLFFNQSPHEPPDRKLSQLGSPSTTLVPGFVSPKTVFALTGEFLGGGNSKHYFTQCRNCNSALFPNTKLALKLGHPEERLSRQRIFRNRLNKGIAASGPKYAEPDIFMVF